MELARHDHDRTWALMEHRARHGAKQERPDCAGAIAADHEKVSRLGFANERIHGVLVHHVEIEPDAWMGVRRIGDDRLEVREAGLLQRLQSWLSRDGGAKAVVVHHGRHGVRRDDTHRSAPRLGLISCPTHRGGRRLRPIESNDQPIMHTLSMSRLPKHPTGAFDPTSSSQVPMSTVARLGWDAPSQRGRRRCGSLTASNVPPSSRARDSRFASP